MTDRCGATLPVLALPCSRPRGHAGPHRCTLKGHTKSTVGWSWDVCGAQVTSGVRLVALPAGERCETFTETVQRRG